MQLVQTVCVLPSHSYETMTLCLHLGFQLRHVLPTLVLQSTQPPPQLFYNPIGAKALQPVKVNHLAKL